MTDATFDTLLRPLKVVTGLLGVMLLGTIVAGGFFVASLRGNDRAILNARTEARHAQCLRDNKQADDAATYARNQAQVLVDASFRGRSPTDAERQRAAAYLKAASASAQQLYPRRTCTRAAEDAYYRQSAR